jgi:Zn-dependent protease with chaperone function
MMQSIQGSARMYGGGSPPTGEDARFALNGEALLVDVGSRSYTVPLTTLRLREVGTGTIGLELAWETDGTLHALQVFDPAALQALYADARMRSLPQMAALHASRRRSSVTRSIGWTAITIFLLFPLLVILVFVWQADRIAAAAASRISIEQETQFGEQAFASMRGSLTLEDSGPAYEAVQRIGERLTQGSKYRYRFHVAKNDAINAFAVPGGIIVVNSGLIEATRRPEELAGVLAHEVQHVEQRHSLEAMVKDLGLRGLWALVSGDLGGGLIGQAAVELTSLNFSRDAEAEADDKGFDTLVTAGIDPSGMADFFIIMAKQEGSVAPPPLMSTHPASKDREAALRARVAQLNGKEFVSMQMGPWPPRPDAVRHSPEMQTTDSLLER